jgi:hypothetical protein
MVGRTGIHVFHTVVHLAIVCIVTVALTLVAIIPILRLVFVYNTPIS